MLSLLLILNAITKLLKVFYYLNIEYVTVYRVYVLVSWGFKKKFYVTSSIKTFKRSNLPQTFLKRILQHMYY